MHRTKPSRARLLVPSALALVILSGAAAPAVAAEGDGSAALTDRVASVKKQVEKIERRAAAAGPIDDLLAGLTKTLEGLLATVGGLLPDGVTLPPIELPQLPDIKLPELPDLSGLIPQLPPVELPPVDALPEVPTTPAIPDIPVIPTVPDIPAVP
ncbi:hypothetical protein ACFWB2_44255 [Streptomyces virginiae]|uniref:hypothetical protein n=1 Tax=Streptomyces TaxID=1883 RepID=UPI0005267940|nr:MULTISPECIES: hypothetical protein [Streptomyces]MYV76203.1 hypothetical protein [Streptomyces sp. SID1046]WSC78123.1 hypothetical protein OHA56_18385 [Streptomyces virginiae]